MRYVLDTTAFSAAMKKEPSLMTLLRSYRPGDIVTVPPVVAEIQYGIIGLRGTSKKVLLLKAERDRLLSIINVLPWPPEASQNYGEIKANLERRGKIIDDFDIAIAAIAISHNCGVLTANLKHFKRIKDLKTLSWIEEGTQP
jgi:tRNA(fMet)-specific endonuclease VapC